VASELEEEPKPTQSDPPRGIYPARVDDKGRLKLPVNFERYLAGQKLFVTTLDERIARIYPLPVWQENERLLFDDNEDTDAAEDLSFIVNKYGADAEVDNQGRVLMPTVLRRALSLENQPVHIDFFKGAVNVYNETVYQEREQRAGQNRDEKLKAFRKKGLK
jgi:MraZ protein